MPTFTDTDPATGEAIAEIEITSAADLDAAVARARAAQPAWAALAFSERRALLAAAAGRLAEEADALADLATREMGKPRREAVGEVRGFARAMESELDEIERAIAPEVLRTEHAETHLVREPHGVVAAITPWNFPVGMPLQILVPALGTGNAVVFKPSEHVPLTGAKIAEILQAFLPAGVLELVQGPGETGARLVAADVDMVGFVGSRATGQAIMRSASEGLKRLVLELGGKDPMIVLADADLDAAAECAVRHSLRNTGQVCCSVERVFVAAPVAERFEALVVEKARAWTHGSGFAEATKMGPLVSEEQRRKVAAQVADARERGARVLLGGEAAAGPGWFYPATVVADVTGEHALARDETFGPVVCLSVFDGAEAEAVRLANDTPYGLGANVWTGDRERGVRIARGIRAGQVGVNRYLTEGPGLPWVGARQSGFGFLGGVEGHRQFTTPKSISVPLT